MPTKRADELRAGDIVLWRNAALMKDEPYAVESVEIRRGGRRLVYVTPPGVREATGWLLYDEERMKVAQAKGEAQ